MSERKSIFKLIKGAQKDGKTSIKITITNEEYSELCMALEKCGFAVSLEEVRNESYTILVKW